MTRKKGHSENGVGTSQPDSEEGYEPAILSDPDPVDQQKQTKSRRKGHSESSEEGHEQATILAQPDAVVQQQTPKPRKKKKNRALPADEKRRRAVIRQQRHNEQQEATAQLRLLISSEMTNRQIPNFVKLANQLDLSARAVYNFMTADHAIPTIQLILALWQKFDMDIHLLLKLAAPHSHEAIDWLHLDPTIHDLTKPIQAQQSIIDEMQQLLTAGPLEETTATALQERLDALLAHTQRAAQLIEHTGDVAEDEQRMLYAYWKMLPPDVRPILQQMIRNYAPVSNQSSLVR